MFGVALPELSVLPERFTVKDIAANLVEAVCASEVEAPYHLAGWSHAGLIAYEMARQLRARGKHVALLMLFDTNSPAYLRGFKGWWNAPIRLYFLFEKWFYYLKKTRNMPLHGAWRYFREQTQKFQLRRPRDAAETRASLRGGPAGAAAYAVVADAVSRRGELRA